MAEGTAGTRKWWLEATYVTAVSAAIIVPGVTLLDHCLDYRLEAAKQTHGMRQTYLDRAIDPHRSSEYRRSVLTFLTETLADDKPMRSWAGKELERLERALELEVKLAAAERKTQELTKQLSEARSTVGKGTQEVAKLAQDLRAAKTEVNSIWQDLTAAEREANIAPSLPGSTSGSSPPSEGAQEKGPDIPAAGGQATGKRGDCCIPCNGILVCGKSVTTDCGSCEGEGTF